MVAIRSRALGAFAVVLPVLALVACGAPADEIVSDQSEVNAIVCGNGVREAGEQCDDGNTASLDGCTKTCGFEQVHRMDKLEMLFNTDTYCTGNALGGAIKG